MFLVMLPLINYANLCKFGQNHIKCPNVFGDAALISYANLCKFGQNHIKCSYFLIS